MLQDVLAALEAAPLATGLRSSVWAYPLVNAGHLLGVALLVGCGVPLNLRLLGVWRSLPLAPLRRVLSVTADAGLLLAVACGLLLFLTRAPAYARSSIFLAKMLTLAAGVAGTLLTRALLGAAPAKETSRRQSAAGRLSGPTRAAAAFSLAAWLAVLALGRLIGYF